MRRMATMLIALVVVGVAASAAVASDTSGTHFNKRTTKATISGSTLTVDFTVSGLGNNVSHEYIQVTGEAACVNGGDNKPKADNKQGFAFGADFAVTNGSVTGTISGTATGIHCGTGQTLEYSNLVIHALASSLAGATEDASLAL